MGFTVANCFNSDKCYGKLYLNTYRTQRMKRITSSLCISCIFECCIHLVIIVRGTNWYVCYVLYPGALSWQNVASLGQGSTCTAGHTADRTTTKRYECSFTMDGEFHPAYSWVPGVHPSYMEVKWDVIVTMWFDRTKLIPILGSWDHFSPMKSQKTPP